MYQIHIQEESLLMKEKRHRLNFKQTAKGLIQFDGTVEIVNPLDDMLAEDVAVIGKKAADKLAEESLLVLETAIKKFKEAGHTIAGDDS
jgi:hypothetical protein